MFAVQRTQLHAPTDPLQPPSKTTQMYRGGSFKTVASCSGGTRRKLNAAIALPRDDITNDTAEPEPPPEVVSAEREETLDEDRLDEIWGAWQHEAERLK